MEVSCEVRGTVTSRVRPRLREGVASAWRDGYRPLVCSLPSLTKLADLDVPFVLTGAGVCSSLDEVRPFVLGLPWIGACCGVPPSRRPSRSLGIGVRVFSSSLASALARPR